MLLNVDTVAVMAGDLAELGLPRLRLPEAICDGCGGYLLESGPGRWLHLDLGTCCYAPGEELPVACPGTHPSCERPTPRQCAHDDDRLTPATWCGRRPADPTNTCRGDHDGRCCGCCRDEP